MSASLLAICVGSAKPLFIRDPENDALLSQELSGIQKSAVSTLDDPRPISCKQMGIEGDEQVDLSVHGGPQKAVYCYPFEHYAFWKKEIDWLKEIADAKLFGQAGENLCTQGVLENELFIGDQLHIGDTVKLLVIKPREPCYKFNARMRSKHAAKLMIKNNLSGWYCSVLQEGKIKAGDPMTVFAGPRDSTVAQENERLGRKTLLKP